jgi:signal peptidase I
MRPLLGALISALVPGVGQFLSGQRRKGAILLVLLAVLLFCFWPLRLLRFYGGLLAVFWGWIGLYFYAVCTAGWARRLPGSARPSKWWLALVLPTTLLTMSLIGAGVTRLSGFRSFLVPSSSMEKTIREGDRIIADMNYYRSRNPGKQDVIMFKREDIFFIKRVIGTPGDSVSAKEGVIYVNGEPLDEAYVQHIGEPPEWANDFGPETIPDGKYFVMGDNRDVSLDSRSPDFGLVPASSVVGKPLYVFGSERDGKPVH